MAHPQCRAERPQIDAVYWDSQHARQKRQHQESGQLEGIGTAAGSESIRTARVLQNDLQLAPAAWNLSDQLSKCPRRKRASACAHTAGLIFSDQDHTGSTAAFLRDTRAEGKSAPCE